MKEQFVFIITPDYSLIALSCAIDALRAANAALGAEYYTWTVSTLEPSEPTRSSCGLSLETSGFRSSHPFDTLIVCGGQKSHQYVNKDLHAAIRYAQGKGRKIGALSEASYILAEAGVLEGRQCTIHWKRQHAFREAYPDLDIKGSIFEVDGPILTCAGGLAALDLFLHLVMQNHGVGIAAQVAENFHYDAIREADHSQRASSILRHAGRAPGLVRALLLMEENLEEPISIQAICARSALSQRQISRIFQAEFSATPQAYYRSLRLQRARQLLKQTSLTVAQIAVASGFSSTSHLSKYFQKECGTTPGGFRAGA